MAMKHNIFVLGFLFDRDGERVALFDKPDGPAPARGLNGIGARSLGGEDRLVAMQRAAKRAGVEAAWEYVCSVTMEDSDPARAVHLYRAFKRSLDKLPEGMQAVEVSATAIEVAAIGRKCQLAHGLRWMIEVARDRSVYAGALVTR